MYCLLLITSGNKQSSTDNLKFWSMDQNLNYISMLIIHKLSAHYLKIVDLIICKKSFLTIKHCKR